MDILHTLSHTHVEEHVALSSVQRSVLLGLFIRRSYHCSMLAMVFHKQAQPSLHRHHYHALSDTASTNAYTSVPATTKHLNSLTQVNLTTLPSHTLHCV